jgi:hypothetical protein
MKLRAIKFAVVFACNKLQKTGDKALLVINDPFADFHLLLLSVDKRIFSPLLLFGSLSALPLMSNNKG